MSSSKISGLGNRRNPIMHILLITLTFIIGTFFSLQVGTVEGKDIPFIARIDLPALETKLTNNKGKVIILDFWLHN